MSFQFNLIWRQDYEESDKQYKDSYAKDETSESIG